MPALRRMPKRLFKKTVLSKGCGYRLPQNGSTCEIKIIDDDRARPKQVIVDDVDEPIDVILSDCLRTMKQREECCIDLEHSDAAASEETVENVCPNDTDIDQRPDTLSYSNAHSEVSDSMERHSRFEPHVVKEKPPEDFKEKMGLQLLSFTEAPEIFEMNPSQKWHTAHDHKKKGLELYGAKEFKQAFRRFSQSLKYVISLELDSPSGRERDKDIKRLKLQCYLNVAACQLVNRNFESVVINCSKAVALQPRNAKALYRRGVAHLQLQDYEKSLEDLTAAQSLEPNNKAVHKQLQLLRSRMKELNEFYARAMKKLFS